jgi:hypothetical protein
MQARQNRLTVAVDQLEDDTKQVSAGLAAEHSVPERWPRAVEVGPRADR